MSELAFKFEKQPWRERERERERCPLILGLEVQVKSVPDRSSELAFSISNFESAQFSRLSWRFFEIWHA